MQTLNWDSATVSSSLLAHISLMGLNVSCVPAAPSAAPGRYKLLIINIKRVYNMRTALKTLWAAQEDYSVILLTPHITRQYVPNSMCSTGTRLYKMRNNGSNVHNYSHAFKVMWKSHLSAVWSRVPPLYYSIALSTKFIVKKTRLFALLEGEVEQNRLSLALISFLLPKKWWICSQAVFPGSFWVT